MTSPQHGLIVAGSAVILTGEALETALKAVLLAERARRRNGLPDSAENRQLAAALRQALSAGPQKDRPKPAGAHTDSVRWVTTREAAERMLCTERHARRLARRLDGDRSTGRWQIPETAITEHLAGTR